MKILNSKLGYQLIKMDLNMIKIQPSRDYLNNEIIAYCDNNQIYKYGQIIQIIKKKKENNIKYSILKIQICKNPDKYIEINSAKIWYFISNRNIISNSTIYQPQQQHI